MLRTCNNNYWRHPRQPSHLCWTPRLFAATVTRSTLWSWNDWINSQCHSVSGLQRTGRWWPSRCSQWTKTRTTCRTAWRWSCQWRSRQWGKVSSYVSALLSYPSDAEDCLCGTLDNTHCGSHLWSKSLLYFPVSHQYCCDDGVSWLAPQSMTVLTIVLSSCPRLSAGT